MNNEFGMKELYSVFLKTTYPMRINGKDFDEGEVIAAFDKIQLANFQEVKKAVEAKGGFDNRAHVTWQSTKEVDFIFSQGIFSKEQMALLTGANLVKENQGIVLTQRDKVEVQDRKITLRKVPYGKVFIYNSKGERVDSLIENIEGKTITFDGMENYEELICDYDYYYKPEEDKRISELVIGQELVKGYLSLEARTRVKDDVTGHTRTGIIKIPQLKLMSDLSMRLGNNAPPQMGTFKAVGYPVGSRGDSKVMEILFLEDDIDADM